MKAASEQFNLWSNFNNMLSDAEQKFFASEYAQALELWQEYAVLAALPLSAAGFLAGQWLGRKPPRVSPGSLPERRP